MSQEDFSDIRYMTEEERIQFIKDMSENETVLSGLTRVVLGNKIGSFSLAKKIVSKLILNHFKDAKTVLELHKQLSWLVGFSIKKSGSLTCEGFTSKEFSKPTLIISNHRDIVCDPMYLNYTLNKQGLPGAMMAIGDNLSQLPPWGFQTMRAFGCFMVERGKVGKQEVLSRQRKLSDYIHHVIQQEKQNIWIAQSNGRTLDGIDQTKVNLLRMLASSNKDESPTQLVERLNINVMTISYEYDPCDVIKAKQFLKPKMKRNYANQAWSGIKGKKGQMNLNITQLPKQHYASFNQIAKKIDETIKQKYKIYPAAVAARAILEQNESSIARFDHLSKSAVRKATKILNERLASVKDEEVKLQVLKTYAQPTY